MPNKNSPPTPEESRQQNAADTIARGHSQTLEPAKRRTAEAFGRRAPPRIRRRYAMPVGFI